MGKKSTQRAIIIAGIAAMAAYSAFVIITQIAEAKNVAFRQSWDNIAFESIALTQEYQADEGKWKIKQYDNETMAGIVEKYMPRYQVLVDKAKTLETPERYVNARDLLVKAIQSEKDSNEHFRAYLLTSDTKEYDKSIDLFSLSLKYSAEADSAVKSPS